ncbi:FAD:protein FMN transferase [Mesorhizobium denitrificans]|uniref:FAD:protein FMN transferase n=1 Tax=Mesorhizobium denitrificans TaxID=2294114 RepID=A0A371X673_9HYPH|nr:FAD:protein FMN transferase [Mesorhizobium denitrificans]RFC64726.1 FAD:protein FMN transferase [Mesorhizobium denitrificans]
MRARSRTIHRRDVLTLGAAALLVARPAVALGAAPVVGLPGDAFGTGWRVTLPAGADTSRLRARLAALLEDVDLSFSPWRADSTIARFNAGGEGRFAAGAEIVEVTRAALRIAEASGGRFDPTVGPLVARWGFGPIRKGETPPDGWRQIRAEGDSLSRRKGGLTLDLCGIAKGHALDRMVALLEEAGHGDFLIDLGGELAARGRHPSGRDWHVGIEDPRPDTDDMADVLRLADMAVATSGDRANSYAVGGRRYSHIIDPATGEPVASALASVAVLMPTAREADGWATALMAAGEGGPELATGLGIPALFLFRDGERLRRVATGTFERHLA